MKVPFWVLFILVVKNAAVYVCLLRWIKRVKSTSQNNAWVWSWLLHLSCPRSQVSEWLRSGKLLDNSNLWWMVTFIKTNPQWLNKSALPANFFPPSCLWQHDGKPYCHKPCYAALFGPKGGSYSSVPLCHRSVSSILVFVTFLRLGQGVNIGGAGSYVYDNPVNEAPASVSMETSKNQEEEKRAPARGPVKGEKRMEQK